MSFGSDVGGGSVEGIGGNEAGIGGTDGGRGDGYLSGLSGLYSGGWESQVDEGYEPGVGGSTVGAGNTVAGGSSSDTSVSQAISAMSVQDQEQFFRDVVEPALEGREGIYGKISEQVLDKVIAGFINAGVPGLGTLASLTGLTGKLTGMVTDATFSQHLANQLGISDYQTGATPSDHTDIVKAALQQGVPYDRIQSVYDSLLQQYGGSMSLWDDLTGSTSAGYSTDAANIQAKASLEASKLQAKYQQDALDYMKQMGAIPMAAQKGLAGVYGLPGGTSTSLPSKPGIPGQQQRIGLAKQSPLYAELMGGQQAGEESILRNAATTGGLRSGNVQSNLYDYNTQLQNQALTQAYGGQIQEEDRRLQDYYNQLSGLSGLAAGESYATQVGQGISGIGQTLGAGQLAAGQAFSGGQLAAGQAQQAGTSNLLGLAGSLYSNTPIGGLVNQGVGALWDAGSSAVSSAWDWASDTIGGWF